jgi:hypothetical protein
MNLKELLQKSEEHLLNEPPEIQQPVSIHVFQQGGEWMHQWLHKLERTSNEGCDHTIRFSFYGFLKYGVSLVAFVFSFVLLLKWTVYATPLSILVFYFFEVHFLFLFPMLIDQVKNPVLKSIQATYQTGIIKSMAMVIPIGFYMMAGLCRVSDPFRNWYKGCLVVLIWYKEDVRNRI